MTDVEKSFNNEKQAKKLQKIDYEWKIVWKNVIIFVYIHLASIYGLYLCCLRCFQFRTFVWCMYISSVCNFEASVYFCEQNVWKMFAKNFLFELNVLIYKLISCQFH